MLEKANIKEALNGKDFSKYITPYTLNAVLSSGSSQRYAVGDVIISTKPDDPTIRFGGTWQLLCPGRTMVCIDVNDSSFNTVKKTGGYVTHSHDIRLRLPMDYGDLLGEIFSVGGQYGVFSYQQSKYNKAVYSEGNASFLWNAGHTLSNSTSSNGVRTSTADGDTSFGNSLQPYMVVYVWEKIA